MISVSILVSISLVWTQYKIYQDYVKAFIAKDNEIEQENQVCFMRHKHGLKTLIIIGIVTIITFLYIFIMLIMGLSNLFVLLNSLIQAIIFFNVIPLIYIWRSPTGGWEIVRLGAFLIVLLFTK